MSAFPERNRLRANGFAERTVRHSRFIAACGRAADENEARAFVERHGAAGCRHVCWAFRAGDALRFDDAGEPAGTAGRPILDVIDGHRLDETVIVVSRFFGGVKLGTGGLARAYRAAALDAIAGAGVEPFVDSVELTCRVPFDAAGELHRLIEAHGAEKRDERWSGGGLEAAVVVASAARDAFETAVAEATRGRGRVSAADQPPGD
jgi:putative IMPACT (imprinted ancient) family translation regulator